MKKSTLVFLIVLSLLIPGTLFLGLRLPGRWYYLTSTLIIVEAMLPFFVSFECRKPQARELVTLAVMSALAAASRVAFVFLRGFKPITGIIMITGMAFGPEAGFLTGAISVFASNFFFTQGPWTPWQMMAYGIGGYMAGLIFFRRKRLCRSAILVPYGFLAIMLVVGPLLDTCTVFTTLSKLTWKGALAVYGNGVLYNFRHAVSCAGTLLLAAKPLLAKIDPLQTKYGMMEARE